MKVRTICLPVGDEFSDAELVAAQEGYDVIDTNVQLCQNGTRTFQVITLMLTERGGSRSDGAAGKLRVKRFKNKVVDIYPSMPRDRQKLFLDLRRWRKTQANLEGKPEISVTTEWVLGAIALKAPKTIGELKTIEGCGEAFCKQYGRDLTTLFKTRDFKPLELSEEYLKLREVESAATTPAEDGDKEPPEKVPEDPEKAASEDHADGKRPGELF